MAKLIKIRSSRFKHLNPQLRGPRSQGLNIQATDGNYSDVPHCGIARASNGPRFLLLPYLVISFTIRTTGKKEKKMKPNSKSRLVFYFAYVWFWSPVFRGWVEGGWGKEKPREELRPVCRTQRANDAVPLQDRSTAYPSEGWAPSTPAKGRGV